MTFLKKSADLGLTPAEERAFITIYRQHWKELCAIAAGITKDRTVAQDLVQEVFLSFLRDRAKDRVLNIHAYLIQSLKYQCFKWLRHARVAHEHLARMEKALDENTTEHQVNLSFTNQAIHEIVVAMPDRCREVFELSRFGQLTNEEIASRLNINQRTVENHLARALKILRVSLKVLATFFLFR